MNLRTRLVLAGFALLPACSSSGGTKAAILPVAEAGTPDAAVVGCPAEASATEATVRSGSITTDETWTGTSLIKYDTSLYAGATLTLAPCAIVLIAPGRTWTVTGTLDAQGETDRPVLIKRADPTAPWALIRILDPGKLSLVNTRVEGGGDPLNGGQDLTGMIEVRGDQTLPTQEIAHVENVTLSGSSSNGILLKEGAGFSAASHDLSITGSAWYPISIWSRSAGTIPQGTYTGNTSDEILISTNALAEQIAAEDVTLRDHGVPYHVGAVNSSGEIRVGTMPGNPLHTLTIEAGVTMRFKKDGILVIEHFGGPTPASGALIAVGTASKHITLTSAEATPQAGDWLGVSFGGLPVAASKMDFVDVQYAGGVSTSGSGACGYPLPVGSVLGGAIRINGKPAGEFVTNTTISDSATYGIDRGWNGDEKIDFLATNTFINVAICKQTYPSGGSDGCPDPVPCP